MLSKNHIKLLKSILNHHKNYLILNKIIKNHQKTIFIIKKTIIINNRKKDLKHYKYNKL